MTLKTIRYFLFALLVTGLAPVVASAQSINPSYNYLDAIKKGEVEEVRKLLQRGVSPDTRTRRNGHPALVIAVEGGNLEIIGMILDAGANPDIVSRETGETALLQAALVGRSTIVDMLLKAGANPNQTGSAVETPLIRAIRNNNQRVAKILLENGADPGIADATGNDAVHYARISRSRQIRSLFDNS